MFYPQPDPTPTPILNPPPWTGEPQTAQTDVAHTNTGNHERLSKQQRRRERRREI